MTKPLDHKKATELVDKISDPVLIKDTNPPLPRIVVALTILAALLSLVILLSFGYRLLGAMDKANSRADFFFERATGSQACRDQLQNAVINATGAVVVNESDLVGILASRQTLSPDDYAIQLRANLEERQRLSDAQKKAAADNARAAELCPAGPIARD